MLKYASRPKPRPRSLMTSHSHKIMQRHFSGVVKSSATALLHRKWGECASIFFLNSVNIWRSYGENPLAVCFLIRHFTAKSKQFDQPEVY